MRLLSAYIWLNRAPDNLSALQPLCKLSFSAAETVEMLVPKAQAYSVPGCPGGRGGGDGGDSDDIGECTINKEDSEISEP